jgi:uncharacterized protein Yka (UPF0111/DUF47 family)
MSLQSIVRWLVPREHQFYDFLERQAATAHAGAVALASFKDGRPPGEVKDAVQALEHEADAISHQMEDALARTFVTPIDREDLHRLSNEIDNIIDLANGAIRAAALYGVTSPTEPMVKLMDILVESTRILAEAVPRLRRHEYAEITAATHAMRRLEKEGDAIFRDAVSALFNDAAVDAKKLLREKQVLEDLENALDACEELAETLANLAVKHG